MVRLQKLRSESGSVLLESLLAFSIFWMGALFIFILAYVLVLQIWLITEAHLALICKAEGTWDQTCKSSLTHRTQVLMKFGQLTSIQFYGDRHSQQGVKIQWIFIGHQFLVHQTINWEKVIRKRAL